MKIVLILILMTNTAKADLLLDIMLGNYSEQTEEAITESDYEHEYGNSGGEPEHYSWDNLYPCHYCGIEVIVDPYAESSSDY